MVRQGYAEYHRKHGGRRALKALRGGGISRADLALCNEILGAYEPPGAVVVKFPGWEPPAAQYVYTTSVVEGPTWRSRVVSMVAKPDTTDDGDSALQPWRHYYVWPIVRQHDRPDLVECWVDWTPYAQMLR